MPEDIEKEFQGGPRFKTTILTLSSGFEKRNIDWELSKGTWSITYGPDQKVDQDAIKTFFYARQGRGYGFRFKDWMDYQIGDSVTDTPQLVASGDDTTDKFQIVKKYTSGSVTFNRPITRPVSGTIRVFEDTGGGYSEVFAGFTVDSDTGVIDYVTPPATGTDIGVICEFDVPVRFDSDRFVGVAQTEDVYSVSTLDIVELREALADLS
jgi:uncharacterized protein (TIGR02217 family)